MVAPTSHTRFRSYSHPLWLACMCMGRKGDHGETTRQRGLSCRSKSANSSIVLSPPATVGQISRVFSCDRILARAALSFYTKMCVQQAL